MDDDRLISKKELLKRYGISYGALYRWKRMGLIPEEWFIKKATSTGQETFFDERTVCERINQILAAKDHSSLQELARTFSSQEEEEQPCLVVETGYETRQYRVSDIKSIRLVKSFSGLRENDFEHKENEEDLMPLLAMHLSKLLQGGFK